MYLSKRRILALAILAFYLLSPVTSWACSSMIVGKNASATGRPMISRTADSGVTQSRKFIVVPAGFYSAGEHTLTANGFKFTFTHPSYKYTAVPNTTRRAINDGSLGSEATSKDALPHWEDGYHFTHDSAGVNEKGLAVSGTNTTGIRSGIGMTTGNALWTEPAMAKVLLAEAANCQEALAVVEKILASGQGMAAEITQIADQNEAWIIDPVGRHHYVATRVPDDSFGVIANVMRTQFFDKSDTANFRSNFDPEQYAIDNGFARFQSDDKGVKRVNIALSYGPDLNGAGNTYRVWRGFTMFAPSQGSKIKLLTTEDYYGGGGTSATSSDMGMSYPTYIKPDRKISAMDVTWFQRDRYAGTPFDVTYLPQYTSATGVEVLEGSGASSYTGTIVSPPGSPYPTAATVRPVGHTTHRMTHVFETGTEFPPEIGSRFFIGMGPLETGVSLPFYGNITDTHPIHKFDITEANTPTSGLGNPTNVPYYDQRSGFMIFAHLGYLARGDRVNYAAPIKAFWRDYELKLYEDQQNVIEAEIIRLHKEVSPAASAKFATDYTIAVSDRMWRAAIKIQDALIAHIATAPNTLFKIPAELLEPTVNDSALVNPTDDDKKAVQEAFGGLLLTRDDGNVKVTPVEASVAPHVSGYKFDLPGADVDIALKPEQVAANQTAAKLIYEVELNNSLISAFGGLNNLKKNLAFVMSLGGETLKLVGPSGALISFTDALTKGIATLTLTTDGAIVTIEYILADGEENSGVYNDKLVVFDGNADGDINGSIWLATPTSTHNFSGDGDGCDAGLGYAALGLFGMLIFARKKSK